MKPRLAYCCFACILLAVSVCYGQSAKRPATPTKQSVTPKAKSPSLTENLPAAASKERPSLAFNSAKNIPPIIDSDALLEEEELRKKLPGNEFIGTQRALHE